MNKCFKTRGNDQWSTPKNIYNYFMAHGYIDFNPLCENYDDSLKKTFDCPLFCNPPYSNIEPFVDYILVHSKKYVCVMLLPVRSGTKWFRKLYDCKYSRFYFFTQRLHFNDSKSAPFDCMLVILDSAIVQVKTKIVFIDRDLNIVGGDE